MSLWAHSIRTSFRPCFALIILCLLAACSRDYEIKPKEPFLPDEVPDCPAIADESVAYIQTVHIDNVSLSPIFSQGVTAYTAEVGYPLNSVVVTPVLPQFIPDGVTVNTIGIEVNGNPVDRLQSSEPISLSPGINTITLRVTAQIRALPYSQECRDAASAGDVTLRQFALVERDYAFQINRLGLDEANVSRLNLAASTFDAGDRFGHDMAMDNGNLLVGVPYEDSDGNAVYSADSIVRENNNKTDSGAVYVYRLEDGEWESSAYVKAPNSDSGDLFGYAVAIDGEWMAISAPREDNNQSGTFKADATNLAMQNNAASDSGAVYIYRQVGTDWEFHSFVKSQHNDVGIDGFDDGFGEQIELSGGYLYVSAPREDGASDGRADDNSVARSGAVFVYRLNESTDSWLFDSRLKSDNARVDDLFGSAISAQGDRVLIGAPGEDSQYRSVENAPLIVEDPDEPEIVPPRANASAPQSGAAYLFERENNAFAISAVFKASNSDSGDGFGGAVALGEDRLLVAAPSEDGNGTSINRNMANNSAPNAGAVYVYERFNNLWVENTYLKASRARAGDAFGTSVVMLNDTVLVGAPNHDITALNEGQVYVYEAQTTGWTELLAIDVQQQNSERLGTAMVIDEYTLMMAGKNFVDRSTGSDVTGVGRVTVFQF